MCSLCVTELAASLIQSVLEYGANILVSLPAYISSEQVLIIQVPTHIYNASSGTFKRVQDDRTQVTSMGRQLSQQS